MDMSGDVYAKVSRELDAGKIPDDVRQLIRGRFRDLSQKARVSCIQEGRKWLIKDEGWERILEISEAPRDRSVVVSPRQSAKKYAVQVLDR
jgi:hypothetical protein